MTKATEVTQNKTNSHQMEVSFLLTLIGSIVLVITFFMPFVSATREYKEVLKEYHEEMSIPEIGMTNEDAIHISLFDFGRIYYTATGIEELKTTGIFYLVVIILCAIFALFTLIFSALKKPVATVIFNILSFIAFFIMKYDSEAVGIASADSYRCGIAQYLYCICTVLIICGSIVLLITKRKLKKQHKTLS